MSSEAISLEEQLAYTQRALEMQKKARQRAEALLEDKSRELYNKNQSLQKALETLSEQQSQLIAQEKLASIGQLGASLAHELNNPNAFIQNNLITLDDYINQLLTGIIDLSDLLRAVLARNNDPETQQTILELEAILKKAEVDFIKEDREPLISESVKGSERISIIANSLRYFTNPDSSTEKSFALDECIQQALHLITTEQSQSNICMELADIPAIKGLPLLLSQAIANIITNAFESHAQTVKIKTSQIKDSVLIEVSDDGQGMDEETKKHAFDSFFTLKKDNNGLGLGIAKSIIDQHDGDIAITSDLGKGCTITIALPLR